MHVGVRFQVKEHTSHLEAELEKHMAAASAECQSYAKEVAGVSFPWGLSLSRVAPPQQLSLR